MSLKVSPMRLASLLVAFVIVAGAWSASQARIHSLGGNMRFQIGDGLPIPIGFTPVPDGKVAATSNATIRLHGHHLSTSPARVVIDPFQMKFDGPPINLPVFNSNPNVFQVKTDISLKTFFGRGSGESFQMEFNGDGFVVIQPYEESYAQAGPAG